MLDKKESLECLGVEVEDLDGFNRVMDEFKTAVKTLKDWKLSLSDYVVKDRERAPFLDSLANNWNQLFVKCGFDFEFKLHEFKNHTNVYFINYSKGTMLSGDSFADIFTPYQVIKLVELIKKSLPQDRKQLTGFGVMVRKDFVGSPLKGTTEYIGEHTYRGQVENGYLKDKSGKRHSLESNYIIKFKFFEDEKEMQRFNF